MKREDLIDSIGGIDIKILEESGPVAGVCGGYRLLSRGGDGHLHDREQRDIGAAGRSRKEYNGTCRDHGGRRGS